MVNPEKLATLRQHDTRRRQTNKNNNTICVWHHYVQTNTENKTWALQQTTGGNEVKTIQILVTYAFGRRTLYIYFPCIREIWRFVHPRNMTISRGNKFAYLPYAKEWMFYSTRPTFFWILPNEIFWPSLLTKLSFRNISGVIFTNMEYRYMTKALNLENFE